MTVRERLLSALVEGLRPLLPATVLVSRRVARAAAERRGVAGRLEAWAAAHREPERPLVWLHGASAGELEGAAAVVAELRGRRELQLAVSYFSPSAEPFLPRLDPDVAEPLPLDVFRTCRRAVRAVRPDAVVFARGDVWPNFTRAAAGEGVPLALVNAVVTPDSDRLGRVARWLTAPAYGRLDRVGAASVEDAERLTALGVEPSAIRVTGDAALDTAASRLAGAAERDSAPAARLRALLPPNRPVLLGGSTWREDEAVLLETARRASGRGVPLALVLVPHEPGADALHSIERRCREALGLGPRLWSETAGGERSGREAASGDGGAAGAPLVVDEVGVLAELYPAADVAWVGGGLGDDGLHSVVEPAAAGVAVLFGDRSTRPEAEALRRRGGGAAHPPDEAPDALLELLADPSRREAMGRAARGYVEEGAGAARAAADLVEELLGGPAVR